MIAGVRTVHFQIPEDLYRKASALKGDAAWADYFGELVERDVEEFRKFAEAPRPARPVAPTTVADPLVAALETEQAGQRKQPAREASGSIGGPRKSEPTPVAAPAPSEVIISKPASTKLDELDELLIDAGVPLDPDFDGKEVA